MKAIYFKELKNYFKTPLGYAFMAFMLVLFGIYFFLYGLYYQTSDYTLVLNAVTMLILFALPLLTMRMFSEEMRNKTDQLLFTSPVASWKIVLGKYFAAMTIFVIVLAITVTQPLLLTAFGATPPTAKVIGGYIGFLMYGFAFISLGMLISALTENQLVAALATIGLFMVIFLLDGIATLLPSDHLFQMIVVIVVLLLVTFLVYRVIKDAYIAVIIGFVLVAAAVLLFFFVPSFYDNLLVKVTDWVSLVVRYNDFYTGVFDFSNVVFYLTFSGLMVFLTIQAIEKRRWS